MKTVLNKCPKCEFEGDKDIVRKFTVNDTTYTTCRNCNRTTISVSLSGALSEFVNKALTKVANESELMFPLDAPTFEKEMEPVVRRDVEEVTEATPLDATTEEKESEPVDEPTLPPLVVECPKCDSIDTFYELTSAKTGYITCNECGYDSKAVGKRHRIGM